MSIANNLATGIKHLLMGIGGAVCGLATGPMSQYSESAMSGPVTAEVRAGNLILTPVYMVYGVFSGLYHGLRYATLLGATYQPRSEREVSHAYNTHRAGSAAIHTALDMMAHGASQANQETSPRISRTLRVSRVDERPIVARSKLAKPQTSYLSQIRSCMGSMFHVGTAKGPATASMNAPSVARDVDTSPLVGPRKG